MNHGSKQFLAWTIAFGLSTAIYGGGAYWLKKSASNHGDNDHDLTDADEHGGDNPQSNHETAHGDSHASAHNGGSPSDGHEGNVASTHNGQLDEEGHAKDHGADHGKTPHTAEHGEQHASKTASEGDHHASAAPAAHEGKAKETDSGHHALAETNHGEAKPQEHAQQNENKPKNDGHATHWTYGKNDANGPSHWGDLAKNFSLCEKGMEQSPIDIRKAASSNEAPEIAFHYGQASLNVENNGHTIQSNLVGGDNHITIDGEKYSLAQFHFHSPSEHRIAGASADLELHFVHKNSSGGLAVIGLMIHERSGKENKLFKPVWDILPRELNSKATQSAAMSLSALLPANRQYFHYKGSLTTPPCSEGVRWFVLKDPATMSGGQVEMYSSIFDGPSNRPVQPLQGRDVITNGPPSFAH